MEAVLLLLIFIFLGPVLPLCLPKRWAYFGFALCVLFYGWVWLTVHTRAVWEDGDRLGFDGGILTFWPIIGFVGLVFRWAADAAADRNWKAKNADKAAQSAPPRWPIPIGAVAALFFTHWLSNRLAGASPAWVAHVAVFGLPLAIAAFVWRYRAYKNLPRLIPYALVAASLSVSYFSVHSAIVAWSLYGRAKQEAGANKFCVLTYAGRDRERPAKDVLELSQLVSRRGGRNFVRDGAYWLVVETNGKLVSKEWRRYANPPHFEDAKESIAPKCKPVVGGNI